MTADDIVGAVTALLVMAWATGVLMWANIQRKKRQRERQHFFGLPRCRGCRRVWDEHTNIGACPDGSGHFYES